MIKKTYFDRIEISISLKPKEYSDTPPEIEVAETCFLLARAVFQVLAMVNNGGFNKSINPFEAIQEVSGLGAIFCDLAFNSLDEYGIRIHHENKNGGQNDAK